MSNFFNKPQTKAMLSTLFITTILFLGLTGLFWLTVNHTDQVFAILLSSGIVWFMYTVYNMSINYYKNKSDQNG